MQVIIASIPTSEPALPATAMDTKKSNYNFCLTPMFRVNYVMGKDIRQRSLKSNGEAKTSTKS